MKRLLSVLLFWGVFLASLGTLRVETAPAPATATVYVLPLRNEISPPLTYLVRRGVKEAMQARADLLILEIDTNGGSVKVTEEIIAILGQFKGRTVAYVNQKAYSAGAFIAVSTEQIFMAPQSVIGAATPLLVGPGGAVQSSSDAVEAKMTSALNAKIRTLAEKNGYNPAVVSAMIDRHAELILDGEVINPKGQILTLTNLEAQRQYGQPGKALLSSGTMESLETLLRHLGLEKATVQVIEETGAEKVGIWLNRLSPLWLMLGVIGVYLEMKTPGFGLPGMAGITGFTLYFLGGYVAGLSGMVWMALFVMGLAFVIVDFFLFPGTFLLGMAGALLMLVSIIMAMVDVYPGMPLMPTLAQLERPLRTLFVAVLGTGMVLLLLSRILPRTPLYHHLVLKEASGMEAVWEQEVQQESRLGRTGVAISVLRPSGKAQFGQEIYDVISQGDLIEKGHPVRIIGNSGNTAVVEEVA